MQLVFLGTGAGVPSLRRNVSSLWMLHGKGEQWVFDCGEGTQQQALRAPVKLSRVSKVFVTHLHGDHIFGLPGLLGSRSFHGTSEPVDVYGPPGIRKFLATALDVSQSHLSYDLHVHEIQPGPVLTTKDLTVKCRPLDHGVPSYGYRIVEADRPGRLHTTLLQSAGIPPGPIYGRIKAGESVQCADGSWIRPHDVMSPPIPGRTVAILGDTRPCPEAEVLAAHADVLVHEATFFAPHSAMADPYGHSTARSAAILAKHAGVDTLLLTHVSSRYSAPDLAELLNEARSVHPKTFLAHDLFTYSLPQAPRSREGKVPPG